MGEEPPTWRRYTIKLTSNYMQGAPVSYHAEVKWISKGKVVFLSNHHI